MSCDSQNAQQLYYSRSAIMHNNSSTIYHNSPVVSSFSQTMKRRCVFYCAIHIVILSLVNPKRQYRCKTSINVNEKKWNSNKTRFPFGLVCVIAWLTTTIVSMYLTNRQSHACVNQVAISMSSSCAPAACNNNRINKANYHHRHRHRASHPLCRSANIKLIFNARIYHRWIAIQSSRHSSFMSQSSSHQLFCFLSLLAVFALWTAE